MFKLTESMQDFFYYYFMIDFTLAFRLVSDQFVFAGHDIWISTPNEKNILDL